MPEMPSGDPHIENILEKVPKKVAKTLTPEQWEGFRKALIWARSPTRHLLDLRFILPLYFTRIYCIVIFGKDMASVIYVSCGVAVDLLFDAPAGGIIFVLGRLPLG